jgi:hypothetical protein
VAGPVAFPANDVFLNEPIGQTEIRSRQGSGSLIAIVVAVFAVLWALGSNLETASWLNPGVVADRPTTPPVPPQPNLMTYETVAAMPCVNLLNAHGTYRLSELTDPLVQVVGQREGGLGSVANMTSYVLTECRLNESKNISQAVDNLFEQKRRGRLPQIPIGGATSDPYVRANRLAFDKWIHHGGPRPDFSKITGR